MSDINENVYISEDSDNIEIIETVEVIEVSEPTSYTIDSAEAFPALGETNENLKHQLLNGRELADQHPIAAITGLRDELDDIESLQVIYSPERNQANYYLWQDENILQENRVGYFVSARSDINEIEICTSDNEIFGVTVDNAGFIGAQSDVVRDIKYGLVVNTGIVHVRCELPVEVGDYVISNDYGCAKKNANGYQVVGRHKIDGVEYAEIMLVTPMSQICTLTDNFNNVSSRMDDAEKNIISAINVSNAAYNKAGEANSVSEEAVKNALEALNKSNETAERTYNIESNVSSTNEIAVQARAIAETAAVSAETIRSEAVATANDALTNVNNLVKDLEPITTWEDAESGNTGAEYFTTYIKEGLATKVEVQTVENLTEENKSAIEKNAESIQTMISSVDKYSVGEYSQSYGLTQEQAASILTKGMVYIPTKHNDSDSHSETFADTEETNEFTPGCYYVWDGNDWIESSSPLVAFFSEELAPSNMLQYWYIDSNEPPEGYEAHALYINKDGQWTKVNILDGNANNRITSMIRQTADGVALEVANARGSFSGLDARLTNTDSQLELATFWNNPNGNKSNLAAMQLDSSDDGSSLALVVMSKDGENVVDGANIILGANGENSYIQFDADRINFTAEDYQVIANNIDLTGYVTIESLGEGGTTTIDGARITTGQISADRIDADQLHIKAANIDDMLVASQINADGIEAENVKISGNITAPDGKIGLFDLKNGKLIGNSLYMSNSTTKGTVTGLNAYHHNNTGNNVFLWTGVGINSNEEKENILNSFLSNDWKTTTIDGVAVETYIKNNSSFYVTHTGELHATKATIAGTLKAGSIIGGGNEDEGSVWQIKKHFLVATDAMTSVQNDLPSQNCVALGSKGVLIKDQYGNSSLKYWTDIISSDQTLKDNINSFSEKYNTFYDDLKPCFFNYNLVAQNGDPNLIHFGFVAQEVIDAQKTNNIDNSALVSTNSDGYYGLYYTEFIALNTWQIQKAKARITELENKVAELEEKLKEK